MKPPETKILEVYTPVREPEREEGKLYFLSANYESGYRMPQDIQIVEPACFDRQGIQSSIFWEKFRHSERIVIIDKFFMQEDLDKVINIFRKNTNKLKSFKFFKLFTKNIKEKKSKLDNLNRLLSEENSFEVYEISGDFIHDRFAILDDELFHFGGTVGGKPSEGFGAFSCGWNASRIDLLLSELERSEKFSRRIIL